MTTFSNSAQNRYTVEFDYNRDWRVEGPGVSVVIGDLDRARTVRAALHTAYLLGIADSHLAFEQPIVVG